MSNRTQSEIRSYSIAQQLMAALRRIEQFQDDPQMVFDDCKIILAAVNEQGQTFLPITQLVEVQQACELLNHHFCGKK